MNESICFVVRRGGKNNSNNKNKNKTTTIEKRAASKVDVRERGEERRGKAGKT